MPGEPGLEYRIRSLVRWNALAMVVQANRENAELGGHIATFASAATLYDVGFNHFWKGPEHPDGRRPGLHPGPLLARHLRARLPRGPAQRGAAPPLPAGGRPTRASRPIRTPG